MSNSFAFSCTISSTNFSTPLGIEVWLDQTQIFAVDHVLQSYNIRHEFDDDEAAHQLKFVLKNKRPEHTKIDDHGQIISDARLIIDNLEFDGIDISQVFQDKSVYEHNFNDTADPIKDKFFGEIGCNGTVTLEFTCPFYLWLLENI